MLVYCSEFSNLFCSSAFNTNRLSELFKDSLISTVAGFVSENISVFEWIGLMIQWLIHEDYQLV